MSGLSVFQRFTEQGYVVPQEITDLLGKTLTRKRDGSTYRIARRCGQSLGGKPAAYLEPIWGDGTRSHWKTYEAILKDFRV